jgi:hypothetical protein
MSSTYQCATVNVQSEFGSLPTASCRRLHTIYAGPRGSCGTLHLGYHILQVVTPEVHMYLSHTAGRPKPLHNQMYTRLWTWCVLPFLLPFSPVAPSQEPPALLGCMYGCCYASSSKFEVSHPCSRASTIKVPHEQSCPMSFRTVTPTKGNYNHPTRR